MTQLRQLAQLILLHLQLWSLRGESPPMDPPRVEQFLDPRCFANPSTSGERMAKDEKLNTREADSARPLVAATAIDRVRVNLCGKSRHLPRTCRSSS